MVRSGQTPFSSFFIWLSADKCLLLGGERRGWIYPTFRSEFGSHVLLLCFENSVRVVFFILFDRPVGKTAVLIPRGSTQKPGYIMDPKLVWFVDFKIQFRSCVSVYREPV